MVDNVQWHRRLVDSVPKDAGANTVWGISYCYPYETLLTDIDFPPIVFYQPMERNFAQYATQFEREFSTLVLGPHNWKGYGAPGRGIAEPVVSDPKLTISGEELEFYGERPRSEDYTERDIVGHMGYFSLDQIKIPSNGPRPANYWLSALKAIHTTSQVWVSARDRPGYVSFGPGSSEFDTFRLVTDVDGRVLWCVDSSRSTAGAKEGFVQARVGGWIAKKAIVTVVNGVVEIVSMALVP